MEGDGRGGMLLGAALVKEEPGWGFTDQVVVKEEAESTDKECVKAEPSSDSESSRGVCEAAMLAGLYTGHAVKDELVLGPECAQPSLSGSDSAGPRGVSEAAMLAGLYTDHAVKDELVLGPEGLQRPHIEHVHDARGDSAGRSREPRGEGLSLRECSVRLERVWHRGAPPARARGSGRDTPVTAWSDIEDEYTTVDYEKDPICDLCARRFPLKTDLMEHVVVHIHTPTGTEQEEGSGGEEDDSLLPGRRARLARDCWVRLERCDAEATRAEHRINTDVQHATATNTYVCDTCGITYQKKNCLIRHFKVHLRKKHTKTIHTERKTYPCEVCKKHFTQPSSLNVHKRLHTGEKPYSCKICKKAFTQTAHLKSHEQLHTGIKPYSCEICNMKFADPYRLQQHKRSHTERKEKPFTCEICEKKFARNAHLKTHRLMHSGEKPFACYVCKKEFTQSGNLNMHMVVHTGERPYPCEICKNTYTQSSHLKIHKRIHTGERPYKCNICQRSFTTTDTLKTHRRIHTGEKPYSCKVCKEKFRRVYYLRLHEQIHT